MHIKHPHTLSNQRMLDFFIHADDTQSALRQSGRQRAVAAAEIQCASVATDQLQQRAAVAVDEGERLRIAPGVPSVLCQRIRRTAELMRASKSAPRSATSGRPNFSQPPPEDVCAEEAPPRKPRRYT